MLKKKRKTKDSAIIELPTEVSTISDNITDYTFLIYGERKIGKTTLFSEFEDVFFCMFDPPNRGLSIYQQHCPDWKTFLNVIELLEKDPSYCKILVIDTGFMAYERCFSYVCDKLKIDDPRDKGWAAGWKAINREFIEAHDRILRLGIGLGITAHSEIKEVQRRDGSKYDKLQTQLSNAAYKYYNGMVDVIAYYHYSTSGKRQLTISGDSFVDAGGRIQGHFKYTNGEPIKIIPMGNNQTEAHNNLLKAFNNELVQKERRAIKKKKRLGRK